MTHLQRTGVEQGEQGACPYCKAAVEQNLHAVNGISPVVQGSGCTFCRGEMPKQGGFLNTIFATNPPTEYRGKHDDTSTINPKTPEEWDDLVADGWAATNRPRPAERE